MSGTSPRHSGVRRAFRRPAPVATRSLVSLGIALVLSVSRATGEGDADRATGEVDFARQVLPVLSEKCFVCHGPDADESDLRLDSREGATADLGGYQAIDPDDLGESEILFRIRDEEDPMPPEKADHPLTEEERELLTRWVRGGGDYAQHWAYVPPVRDGKATIDSLVEAGFPDGVGFAPEADPATLARRLALVLTGLPPEPEQLDNLLANPDDAAFAKFTEHLLASPRFGEHQARYWLDAVRYGDTHGLHLDNKRGIFPYRDWVVKALNDNLPIDDFVTWQLAGDLLTDPTLEQLVATGFVRMNPTTSEGGAIPEEFQAKNNFDRVETLGTALLGASLICARCHTHKYDPITQREYFELMAFFNSTAEQPLDGNSYTYGPSIAAPGNLAAWDEWEQLVREQDELLAGLELPGNGVAAALAHAEALGSWEASGWRVSPVADADAPPPPAGDWSPAEGLPGESGRLPQPGKARWVEFTVETPAAQTFTLEFGGGPGSSVSVDGAPVGDGSRSRLALPLDAGAHTIRLKLAGTDDKSPLSVHVGHPWEPLVRAGSWEACSPPEQLAMLASPEPRGATLVDGAVRSRAVELGERIADARARFTTTLIARDLPQPRETRLLDRGEYDLPVGAPLEPSVFAVMGPLPDGAPRDRLGLARWLTSDSNPLVARVLVNRVWQRVFGYGLVRTPEEFGLQGEHPTHPELLDWLALEFREGGWDLKQLLRTITSSRTFRQDARRRDGSEDPENRLFARGPSHRLDAEVLRDVALWAGGLLRPEMGGEGVKPWQPPGMWKALMHPASNTKHYEPDAAPDTHRRSLYVYWKRTSPHPMMTLFDAPNRESSCVRRSRSNTPLQSLGLLNEVQRNEAATALAGRLLAEAGPTDTDKLSLLYRLLASREPTAAESRALVALLEAMRERYAGPGGEADARLVLGTGGGPQNPTEHAAWTQVAITALASDAAISLY